ADGWQQRFWHDTRDRPRAASRYHADYRGQGRTGEPGQRLRPDRDRHETDAGLEEGVPVDVSAARTVSAGFRQRSLYRLQRESAVRRSPRGEEPHDRGDLHDAVRNAREPGYHDADEGEECGRSEARSRDDPHGDCWRYVGGPGATR